MLSLEFVFSLSLCHLRTQREGSHLQANKRALARTCPFWHADLGLPSTWMWENNLLFITTRFMLFCSGSPSWLLHTPSPLLIPLPLPVPKILVLTFCSLYVYLSSHAILFRGDLFPFSRYHLYDKDWYNLYSHFIPLSKSKYLNLQLSHRTTHHVYS